MAFKAIITFPLCWALWSVGKFTCFALGHYNNFMITSSMIQSWAGGAGKFWPWDEIHDR